MAQLLSNLPVGAKIKDLTTKYNGQPIVFTVAAKNHTGYPANSVTLLTDRIISLKAFDAKEPTNPNTDRKNYGNNRYAQANLRQWLNKEGSPWYASQHSYDQAPNDANVWTNHNEYDAEAGFLTNFSAAFKAKLLNTTLTVAKNTVTDGGGSETVTDKVFLLSNTEVGLANENGIAEGSLLALFNTASNRVAKPTAEAVSASSYTNASLNASSAWYWWLRSPYASISHLARIVITDGSLHYYNAFYGYNGVRPALNLSSEISVSDTADVDGAYIITWNNVPTLTLSETDGRTLYEGDTLNVAGNAFDTDAGNVVSVKYSINNGTVRTLAAGVSDGSSAIPYAKTLTFTNSKIVDAGTPVTDTLAENTAHTLRVWAEDDKGGTSAIQTRTFYIVANRPPAITVDAFETTGGLIASDSINISGTVSDLDGNNVTLRYKLNGGSFIEIYNGAPGPFSFTIPLKDLTDGANTLTLQAVDPYNFTAQKSFTVNKAFNGADLTTAVARYKLSPSTGTATGVVTWVERDTAATLESSISMVDEADAESFVTMTSTNTVELIDGTTEDEFDYIAASAKSNITLKLKTASGNVKKVSGAFQA